MPPIVRAAFVLTAAVAAAWPPAAQPSQPRRMPPVPPHARPNSAAMYEFLLARRAEAQDDEAAAEAALERAVALDPSSAELRAEQAGFFARQNRAADAVAAAERAVEPGCDSEEGHRILGLVYAAWADGAVDGPAGGTPRRWRTTAIDHLTRIQTSPTMATDLGLQMTLARQLLAAGEAGKAVPLLERVVGQTAVARAARPARRSAPRLGQWDRAAAALEQAAAGQSALLPRARRHLRAAGKWEEAAAAYEKGTAAVRGPGRELRLRRAAALLNIPGGAGAERAVALLTEFVKTNPKDVTGHTLLARAHLQRGAGDDAERAARAALALEPANLQMMGAARRHLSRTLRLCGHRRAARAGHQRRRHADRRAVADFVRLLAEFGGAQQQHGDAAAAVRTFERARAAAARRRAGGRGAGPGAPAGRPVRPGAARGPRRARAAPTTTSACCGSKRWPGVKAGRAADAVGFLERAIGERRTSPTPPSPWPMSTRRPAATTTPSRR